MNTSVGILPHCRAIHTGSLESLGEAYNVFNAGNYVWPAANLAIYVPFVIWEPFPVVEFMFNNGGTVSGSLDVGIYTREGLLLTSSGSTTHTPINAIQKVSVASANLTLSPGMFYMAMAFNNASSIISQIPHNVRRSQQCGVMMQGNAFPLPSTASFSTTTYSYVPSLCVARTSI